MWRVPISRRRLDDIGLTLLFLAIGVGLYAAGLDRVEGFGETPALPRWWGLVLLGCASLFQLMRSAHPGIALAGTTVLLVAGTVVLSSVLIWLVYSDIVYAACVYGSVRLVRALYGVVAILCAATFTLAAATSPTDWRVLFVVVLWLVALLVSPLAYGLAVREHRTASAAERERAQAVSALAERAQAEAIADERRRLARELHDVIAGRLSSIAMHSSAALAYDGDPALAVRALRSVRESSVGALDEMREMIDLLSDTAATEPEPVANGHTTSTLRRLDRLTEPIRAGGTDIAVRCPDELTAADGRGLPAVTDIAAYRILAESLTNAVTHAPGAPITVDLGVDRGGPDGGWVTLRIANPATDVADATGRAHRGIDNMTVRAEAVGGRLHAGRVSGEFVVSATLPVTPQPVAPPPAGTPPDRAGGDPTPGPDIRPADPSIANGTR